MSSMADWRRSFREALAKRGINEKSARARSISITAELDGAVQSWPAPEVVAARVYADSMRGMPPKKAWKGLRQRIEERCSEIGECLHYDSKQRGRAIKINTVHGVYSLSRLYWLVTGNLLLPGQCVSSTCGDPHCVVHLAQASKGDVIRRAAAKGAYSCVAKASKIAKTMRARSRFSDEVIQAVRDGEGPVWKLAEQYGMSRSYAKEIRSGKSRRTLMGANPWAGMGARR